MVVVVVVVTPARRHLAGAGAQITRQDGEREQKQIAKALLVSLPSGATNTQTVAAKARSGRRHCRLVPGVSDAPKATAWSATTWPDYLQLLAPKRRPEPHRGVDYTLAGQDNRGPRATTTTT